MLTHRMVAARGVKSTSKIGQAASIGAYTGRFLDFAEASTNFTDKINNEDMLPFTEFDHSDVTDQEKPSLLMWPSNVISNAWGNPGTNDFMVFFCAEAIVNKTTGSYVPNGVDAAYGGCISLYIGSANDINSSLTLQPYYCLFRYGSGTQTQIFTKWNNKYRSREDGVIYTFAAVKRGNELLHYGYKDGDEKGELLGRLPDVSGFDSLIGNSDFGDHWNNVSFTGSAAFGHGAYGCTSSLCKLWDAAPSGETAWRVDKTDAVCGYISYPAWLIQGSPELIPELTRNVERPWPIVSSAAYQVPSLPNPIAGECSEGGAIEHPQKYLSAGLLIFDNGAPSDGVVFNALATMTERAKAGDKVVDPTLIYGL